MVGQGECAGFTFFGGCCGELLRGGTRGRPRAASRRPRHGCTTNARQTDSLFSLARSLGVKQSTFFFFEFQISHNSRFLLSGVRDVTLQVQGRGNGNFRGRKVPTFPRASRVLVALQSARKKEIFDFEKKRGNGGGSSDSVGGHGRRQSGGSAFTPEGLPPGSNLRLLVAPRRASVRRF